MPGQSDPFRAYSSLYPADNNNVDPTQLNGLTNFIWNIADDVLRARLHQAIEHVLEHEARRLPVTGESP